METEQRFVNNFFTLRNKKRLFSASSMGNGENAGAINRTRQKEYLTRDEKVEFNNKVKVELFLNVLD